MKEEKKSREKIERNVCSRFLASSWCRFLQRTTSLLLNEGRRATTTSTVIFSRTPNWMVSGVSWDASRKNYSLILPSPSFPNDAKPIPIFVGDPSVFGFFYFFLRVVVLQGLLVHILQGMLKDN